jgi:hypothetical protein
MEAATQDCTSTAHDLRALGGHAETIREMLFTLETLTFAGQRHTMSKIVDFVAQHVRYALQRLGCRNGKMLKDLIGWLREESQRALPDVGTFRRRADDLLTLLVTVG